MPAHAQPIPDLEERASDRLHRLATAGREALAQYRSLHSAELLEFDAIWEAMDAISPWVMAPTIRKTAARFCICVPLNNPR